MFGGFRRGNIYYKLIVVCVFLGLNLFSLRLISQEFGVKVNGEFYVNPDYRLLFWENVRSLEPDYPRPEYLRKKSACVTVLYKIRKNGKVENPSVVKIYPEENGRFRKSALRAIRKFKFKPSKYNPDRKEIYSVHMFKYMISDVPTDKMHDMLALKLEREFNKSCSVTFDSNSLFKGRGEK